MIVSMAKAKKLLAPGTRFKTPKGVVGTVLGTKSAHNKALARLACSVEGCRRTHVREISDWGQCDRCRWHSKRKAK